MRWSDPLSVSDLSPKPVEHPSEDELMDGAEDIPVGQSNVSCRIEHGRLANVSTTVAVGVDFELQPQSPWDLHLGGQAQQPAGLKPLNSPEVHGVADAQVDRVPSAAAQPDAAPQCVQQSAR